MARWEPNARERLEAAALELFGDRGYQSVTVAQITERAGLTKASYFRYFADKREALFWGQELLIDVIRQAITEGPPSASPRELIDAALDAAAIAFTPDRHAVAAARQKVIDSDPELRERLIAKRAAIAETIVTALQERGTPVAVARVAGQLGQLAFTSAHQQWAASADQRGFAALAHDALDEAVKAAAVMRADPASSRPDHTGPDLTVSAKPPSGFPPEFSGEAPADPPQAGRPPA